MSLRKRPMQEVLIIRFACNMKLYLCTIQLLSPIPPNVLALGTAAEKGDVEKLKQLLTLPDVDINAVCSKVRIHVD